MSVNLQTPDFCRSRDAFRMQLALPKPGGLTTECGSMRRNLHHLAGESFSGKNITVNRKVIRMDKEIRQTFKGKDGDKGRAHEARAVFEGRKKKL